MKEIPLPKDKLDGRVLPTSPFLLRREQYHILGEKGWVRSWGRLQKFQDSSAF